MTRQPDDDVAHCRVCGCTENAACPGGCHWVPDPTMAGDLCSACAPPGGWDLPFQEHDTPQPITLSGTNTIVAGGLVAMGALTETPLGRFPILILRFDVPGTDPAHMPSVALLMDIEHLRQVPALVEQAVNAAIRKAAGR